jgi:hypothetical protein
VGRFSTVNGDKAGSPLSSKNGGMVVFVLCC